MLGVSRHDEDAKNSPKKLWNTSELEHKRSERRVDENSPYRPREEPEDPGSEMVMPGGVHGVQECPRSVRIERVDGTN